MNVLYVDVVGGAAGDMLLAALLDAGASRTLVSESVSAVLGRRVECTTTEVRRHGLRALALSVPADLASRVRRPHELLEAIERASILKALEHTGWTKQAAAALLGLRRPTLYSKLRKHGIPHRPRLA